MHPKPGSGQLVVYSLIYALINVLTFSPIPGADCHHKAVSDNMHMHTYKKKDSVLSILVCVWRNSIFD